MSLVLNGTNVEQATLISSAATPESVQEPIILTTENHPKPDHFRVYPWRWFVLAVVASLNCANAMSWICYASVSNHVDDFYRGETAYYLSMVFLLAAVPVGFLAMWLAARFGIRTAILIGCWFNGVGALIRLISTFEFMPQNSRRTTVIVGQVVAACAYPFIMFIPTKTAAAWFGDNQRTLANSIATLANPLGVMLVMLLAPRIVHEPSDVIYLNLLIALISLIVLAAGTLGIRSSEPPTPPTKAASQLSMPFGQGVKKLMTSRSFLILLLALGTGMGMFNLLYAIMQSLLCARGYSNTFAGLCCALMICGGFVGAFSSAIIVDKTKKYVEVVKIAFMLAMATGLVFSICALKPGLSAAILICCFVFGFFGLAAYPIGLEMAVECSFPVSETLSAGLIVLSGQILSTLFMIGMKLLRKPLHGPDRHMQTCFVELALSQNGTATDWTTLAPPSDQVVEAYDLQTPLLSLCALASLIVALFVFVFRPKLRRLNLERGGLSGGAPISGGAVYHKQEEMVDLSHLSKTKILS